MTRGGARTCPGCKSGDETRVVDTKDVREKTIRKHLCPCGRHFYTVQELAVDLGLVRASEV